MANKSTTFTKNLSMLNIVGLKESINTLMTKESKYAPVASVCKAYLKKLDEGLHEEQICSDFITDLTRVAIHESAKDVVFVTSTGSVNGDIISKEVVLEPGAHFTGKCTMIGE